MFCNNNTINNLVENEAAVRGISSRVLSIDDACIIEVNGRYLLLVLVSFDNFRTVFVIRISRSQAAFLFRSGIRNCQVFSDTLGAQTQANFGNRSVDLVCVFTIDNYAFLVFVVENSRDRIVVVRFPVCPVIGANNNCDD